MRNVPPGMRIMPSVLGFPRAVELPLELGDFLVAPTEEPRIRQPEGVEKLIGPPWCSGPRGPRLGGTRGRRLKERGAEQWQFMRPHEDHTTGRPATGRERHWQGPTEGGQRQDLHLVLMAEVRVDRRKIGRRDEEQAVVPLGKKPIQFGVKAWLVDPLEHRVPVEDPQGTRTPHITGIRQGLEHERPAAADERQEICQIERTPLPGSLLIGFFVDLRDRPLDELVHPLGHECLDGIMHGRLRGSFGVCQVIRRRRCQRRWEREIADTRLKLLAVDIGIR